MVNLERSKLKYRKIPIISPGLIFDQKTFLLSLFSEGNIIERNFAFQNRLDLTKRNFAFQNRLDLTIKTASTNSP